MLNRAPTHTAMNSQSGSATVMEPLLDTKPFPHSFTTLSAPPEQPAVLPRRLGNWSKQLTAGQTRIERLSHKEEETVFLTLQYQQWQRKGKEPTGDGLRGLGLPRMSGRSLLLELNLPHDEVKNRWRHREAKKIWGQPNFYKCLPIKFLF